MTKVISASELRKHLGYYKRRVLRGETFYITVRGKLVARMEPMVPLPQKVKQR